MDKPHDAPAQPEPKPSDVFIGASFALTHLLIPVALFVLGRYGWNHFGWPGLILGLVLAIPAAFVSVGLLGMAVLGACWLFAREIYDYLNDKAPAPEDRWPPAPETPDPPPPARRGQFRIGRIMAAIAVLAVWLGVGVAVVRPMREPEDKLVAALGVFIVPWLFAGGYRIRRWAERWSDRCEAERRRWKSGRGGPS